MTEAVIALVMSFFMLVCAFIALRPDEPPKTLKQAMAEREDAEEQRFHEWHGEARPKPEIAVAKHHLD